MNATIKLTSYTNGEKILEEKYQGSFEAKGRYLRFEYIDGGHKTHMILCFDDEGLYRLESKGERNLSISCSDSSGTARLSLGAHSIDGKIRNFNSKISKTPCGYTAKIVYHLSFDQTEWAKTRLEIVAEMQ
ncbi:MAG: hypothetical protein E7675_04025 [Ruminococcaceae bacterium]|nr:hypothetical protein [Oscillospiraceae bacterium]